MLLIDAGVPYEDDRMNPSTYVFSFPIKAPEGSKVVEDVDAMDQLALWKIYQEHWCDHKPSCTVYYSDSEYLSVGQWVWDNFDSLSGISFLPRVDHVYAQAPYEAISEEDYYKLLADSPVSIDWESLAKYELIDSTTGMQTLACVGGVCEL